ncbi:Galactoside 2-alpha-L-fucosyltransferase, putative [Ricinus communis]|uniref:Fucosyltransferase n=1 Tax=Ricinus communis TaxID=3988 RepID=B9RLW2_RICCO|nr:Galactoside 2-alpha-L-fucosyltransferase, putative [Ricinus communis]
MKRIKKNPDSDSGNRSDPDGQNAIMRETERKCGGFNLNLMRVMGILVAILMVISVVFSVSVVLKDPPSDTALESSQAANVFQVKQEKGSEGFSRPAGDPYDKLLGGLLAAGFSERTCLSRYQSAFYRKELPHKPSSYLISKLRSYEILHKRCGPHTEFYKKALEQLKFGNQQASSDCSYVVWISYSGLGNRILTLASAFLYALLTNRVLLVDPGIDIIDLFCKPFPEVSWFLPTDFPLRDQFNSYNQMSPSCYGRMLKDSSSTNLHALKPPSHAFLQKIPWLIMKTDNYFIPSLFLIPSFEQELNSLFTNKETVFHFLGRYLFHPTNSVWGLITRYYHAYLAKADEKIGIQIRIFDSGTGPFQYVLDQILSCTTKEKILPEINRQDPSTSQSGDCKSKAVVVTSLSPWYSEKMRNMYWEHPSMTSESVGIYQPSYEEYQQTEKQIHNRKAWAEMYLLSLTDVLVTSSWSTFGYVAQGLGGLKSWILYKPENQSAPDPPCVGAMSMEPCFHAPPFYDCKAWRGIDTGALVPHVTHCEDMSWGLKLVDVKNWV